MAVDSKVELDALDWRLLQALQRDARASYAELGRTVGLSPPAIAERVRRLEEAGVIQGYRAILDPAKVGLGITAVVRMRCPGEICSRLGDLIAHIPEVIDCRRVTGEDSGILTVVATSIPHLQEVIDELVAFGTTTTLVVTATAFRDRPIERAIVERD
ncbi:transcriptional regulator [Aliidongia dinghuensis]|uniref:Transcriptional regulator n=1 Tax=Aliidongia dinghuensis TaxID=1867774 RepID=A0A8J3E4Y8_9PROT|nr:Lrp/AsnC family transcriptional regulator [Aliidongia dinghuensis]GGF28197.1 transcriptional regulator [Aliidongia dinghuensis]